MVQAVSISKNERVKRGTIPPYIGLTEAFTVAKNVYEQGGGSATSDMMSKIVGNSSSSSSFVKKMAALRTYGLLVEGEGAYRLTEQGFAIAAPTSERSEAEAKKVALLSIPTFNRIFERHKGKLLPADEFLKNIIEQEFDIPRELSDAWVSAFKSAARSAGILYDRPDGKIQMMETPAFNEASRDAVASEPPPGVNIAAPPATLNMSSFQISNNFIPIPLGRGRIAKVELPPDWNTKTDLDRFLKMLELSLSEDLPNDGITS
jgi:hypothetical protein